MHLLHSQHLLQPLHSLQLAISLQQWHPPAGAVDVVLSYCHYSLNDTTLGDLIPYLQVRADAL
jgi:hypothetical protein